MKKRAKRSGSALLKRKTSKKYLKYERRLESFTDQMFSELKVETNRVIIPHIVRSSIPGELFTYRMDAPGDGIRFSMLVDQIEAQFLGFYSRQYIERYLRDFYNDLGVDAVGDINAEFARQQLGITPSSNVQSIITDTVNSVAGRIQASQNVAIGDLRSSLQQGVLNGDRWETIARSIQAPLGATGSANPNVFDKAVNRARFIARNTVSETLGVINKEQNLQAGIELYRWQTAEDERVRPTHVALEGRIFSWQGEVTVNGVKYKMAVDPNFSSSGTIPGEPWNCRCVGIPYIPELG